jgi:protein-S-isoprenylcysteine O-methyltransferase Ste14
MPPIFSRNTVVHSHLMRAAVPAVVLPVLVLLLYLLAPGIRGRSWSVTRILGAAAAGTGYMLLCLARIQLGASFSVRPQAKGLITHGLYARVRNPMYVFLDLMLAGLILIFEVPWLFVILAMLVVFQIIQARREAEVLRQRFGKAYLAYRRQTWF